MPSFYTLKSGFQKEKFTIDNSTGELKYKEKQTQVGIHKVAILPLMLQAMRQRNLLPYR
jgi:hypothetical protein